MKKIRPIYRENQAILGSLSLKYDVVVTKALGFNNRAVVLGEFGGQAYTVKDHLWITDFTRAPDHYKTSNSEIVLQEKYDESIEPSSGSP